MATRRDFLIGAVSVGGLLEPNPGHAKSIDDLKRRLDMFGSLGLKMAYTTSGGSQTLTMDEVRPGEIQHVHFQDTRTGS